MSMAFKLLVYKQLHLELVWQTLHCLNKEDVLEHGNQIIEQLNGEFAESLDSFGVKE